MALARQHLIDPLICIRCNTCEATCPVDAITHNEDNYVVDPGQCEFCMACIGPCPTGAIDNWRNVATPWSLEAQFEWSEELPEDAELDDDPATVEEPAEVAEIRRVATAGEGGQVVRPKSSAQPHVYLYTVDDPAVAKVMGSYRITDEAAESDTRHIVLDFGSLAFPVLEGQSIGVMAPGRDERGRPHHVRLYSVASPRDGERPGHNNLSLTVKRVIYEEAGETKAGVASNYLCDLARGDEVRITGPFGDTFLMPDDPAANLIMICTGTGSAPMRAMTERRRREKHGDAGKLLIFFGARTPGELPYFGPLMNLPRTLIDVELAFSRVPGTPKQYVQDRMRQRADDLASLLQSDDTYLYMCGLKGMEEGCNAALHDICRAHGLDRDGLIQRMRETGRYHVETY